MGIGKVYYRAKDWWGAYWHFARQTNSFLGVLWAILREQDIWENMKMHAPNIGMCPVIYVFNKTYQAN